MQLFKEAIQHITIGVSEQFGDLTITPVHILEEAPLNGYVGFDHLFDSGMVEALEVSESGVVGRISVNNMSDDSLCLFDGEALVGAKQNRIVERSLIVPPKTEIAVPVNCVERGRWSGLGGRGRFHKSEFAATPSMKMSKAQMLKERRIGEIQSEMWASVDRVAACHDVRSSSDDLGEIYEGMNRSQFRAMENYVSSMQSHGYMIDGIHNPFIEIFGSIEFCRSYAKKAVRAWMTESAKRSDGNSENALSRLKNCDWKSDDSFGSEVAWVPGDRNNGRVIQSSDGHLVHVFLDLTKAA